MDQKSIKNRSKSRPGRGFGGFWLPSASWEASGLAKVANMGPTWANMVPTWLPKWSQNGSKIDLKIDQIFDASWNRFLKGFWWILGGKLEPSWHQHRVKNRCYLENVGKHENIIKPMEFQWFLMFRGSKLGAKIDQKSIKKWSQDRKGSWHRFFEDFGGLGRQVGRENRTKMDQKSMPKKHRKNDRKNVRKKRKNQAPGGGVQETGRPGRGDPGTP